MFCSKNFSFFVLLYKGICQSEKVFHVGSGKSSNGPLYIKTKKGKFFEEKIVKITKRSHDFKDYVSF